MIDFCQSCNYTSGSSQEILTQKKKRNESYTTKMTRIQPYFVVHLNQTCVMTN